MKSSPTDLQLLNGLLAAVLVFACSGCGPDSPKKSEASQPAVTFKPQEMADALHAVIAADRETYARQIVQPLAGHTTAKKLDADNTNGFPPLHAHMLRLASDSVQQKGAEFHYVLRSLWPINARNAPETPIEKTGLQYIVDHPESNYYSEESLGGRRYFTAVYPDRAVVPACAECHNAHPESPKKDFKQGDLVGGLVVRVPLEF